MINLVIIDFQNDFVSGSLAVPKADIALKNILSFLQQNRESIEHVYFTVDFHPYRHCSFKRCGGEWPEHCIQFTKGAAIQEHLFQAVAPYYDYTVCPKGALAGVEEYASNLLVDNAVVCGLAGDYCVKETIKFMTENGKEPKVFYDGIASIDGGEALDKVIKDYDLVCVNFSNRDYKFC